MIPWQPFPRNIKPGHASRAKCIRRKTAAVNLIRIGQRPPYISSQNPSETLFREGCSSQGNLTIQKNRF